MNRLLLLAVTLLLILPIRLLAEDTSIVFTEEVQLKLADAFLAEGEYYRAVTEYKKFAILFPGSQKMDYALYRIGLAYYRGDDYDQAARTFASIGTGYGGSGYVPTALYQEGVSYWRLDRPDQASAAFDRVVAAAPASEYARLALLGKSLAEFDLDNISACRRELERFIVSYPEDAKTGQVREAIALLDRNRELPQKSPLVAGVMSALIPGSGHLYAGHYGDGITAFFLNGLFIAGTVAAVRQENYAVAGVVGVIGLPFYIGNIYGAANAATKYTIGVKKDLRGKIAISLDYPF
ncbi:MAG: tetratricopeptide repeat protein [Syntrophales bacterium]|nr:tetratricopeptide repeat protein [Syntrophales bacterium]